MTYQIIYHSRTSYPTTAAHALQIFNMANALAAYNPDTHLIVADQLQSIDQTYTQYNLARTPLTVWSLHTKHWLSIMRHSPYNWVYNTVIIALLTLDPRWWRRSKKRILFMRGQRDFEFWGLVRQRLPWLRNWFFIYECHDLQHEDFTTSAAQLTGRAIRNYDLVLAVTENLADDLRTLLQDSIEIKVLRLSSGLAHAPAPQPPKGEKGTHTLGYIGTIDPAHGLDDVFAMLPLLPATYRLRLVGHVPAPFKEWYAQRVTPELAARIDRVSAVEYQHVAREIDACDIVLAPAGATRHSERYRSPLKLFDYMMRGKVIVAADVPSHRELLMEDEQAIFYAPGNPQGLAHAIRAVVENPSQAEAMARKSWEYGVQFTYAARAQAILSLISDRLAK